MLSGNMLSDSDGRGNDQVQLNCYDALSVMACHTSAWTSTTVGQRLLHLVLHPGAPRSGHYDASLSDKIGPILIGGDECDGSLSTRNL